ncbi:MAG: hypothetical protein AUJ96_24345 [Armatimonadetes bacterium CG2_30_66_41]|nr:4Fe-4S binding protein [Armatimonadota bacterium]OIO96723.1 MAG: hypothetical protein AUJ96_24345 [Armatimonadetes bacterium CG2_30_66_41]NCO91255.1 4Fe-4S binding protein [Armatimonadota bacterium]NCP29548.1 4Fe-4S binding protein [Armatimonadota bacterium]NCQ29847.1 4Fe-4S binding protein [Armatimonadota bacterium]
MVQLRRLSQLLFLGLFVYLFLCASQSGLRHAFLPVDLFLRADPLIALMTMLGARVGMAHMVLPSLLVVLVTLFLGRVFCGWVCPLGTVIDLFDRLFLRGKKQARAERRSDTRRYRNLKYYFLLAAFVAAAGGLQCTYVFDPLSLLTRTFTCCVLTPTQLGWNALLGLLGGSQGFRFNVDFDALRVTQFYFRQTAVVFLMVAGILALSSYQERFWCRNLCPLGGLLALFSRVSFLRHRIASGCTHCTRCELGSRMGAYENTSKKAEEPFSHQLSECVHCYRCAAVCPEGVIEVAQCGPAKRAGCLPQEPVALSRRRALGAAALGVGWLATNKVSGAPKYQSDRCIRPPGALPETEFLQACTRCGECMRVCPTNALQPALGEAGLEGWMTPVLVPKIGPCVEQCTLCGQVCPTDALRRFTVKQKREDLKLGLAVVNQNTCIAYNGGRDCIVCAEVCSYSAVLFKDIRDDALGRKKRVPTVDEKLCIGCGICEKECPVIPEHAIVVRTLRENRSYNAPKPSLWGGFTRR